MQNWLAKRANLTPNRMALIGDKQQWTFAELNERAKLTARRLQNIGVKQGDHVAVLYKNGLHFAEVIHALPYCGAVLVPLNTRLTVHECMWQLNDAEAHFLIYDEAHIDQAYQIASPHHDLQTISCDELAAVDEAMDLLMTETDLDALHSILYTSGTTGHPKGVMLTYGNHWWSAIGSSLNLGLHHEDRWLACVPLFHVSGLSILMRSVIYGMTAVIHETFDPEKVNQTIQQEKITIVSVVSAMLSRMVESLKHPYPETFRCMLLGGGPAPKPLLEKCKDEQIPVFQTYGMTETASQIVTLGSDDMLRKLGSAGKPLFPSDLSIVKYESSKNNERIGEIIVRGPNVTKGYFNRRDATAKTIKNGWLHTGDIGYVDDEGFLYVLDRRNDLIISGGENVYPAEIEGVLLAHPDVKDAGVTGIANEHWGQVPVGFVQLKNTAKKNKEHILDFCRERLASYKLPDELYFVDSLPRNASNKLIRRQLQKLLDSIEHC